MPRRLCFVFLLLMVFIPAVYAQAPDQVNAALADLGSRVGHAVALGDLQRWFWEQQNYPDASLGCPQPGQTYAQVVTVGYKFTFTYLDIVYDYRVSVDSATVILCGTSAVGEATATPVPENAPQGYVPPCPAPEADKSYMRIRLALGTQGRVVPGLPNNVRAEPSTTSALAGEIPGSGVFNVLAGPRCGEGLVWWQVDYDGLVGWTVEGRDASYWIEPLPARDLPGDRIAITKDNADLVTELSRVQGNLSTTLAFSPNDNLLGVLGSVGSDGVWLYTLDALSQAPRIVESDDVLSTVQFSPTRSEVLTGGFSGRVFLWDLKPDAPVVGILSLQSHVNDIAGAVFEPNGDRFAVAGNGALTTQEVDKTNAILIWDRNAVTQQAVLPGHTGRVYDLAFNPDGTLLVSGSADKTVRLWDIASASAVAVWEHPAEVYSVAFSPDGKGVAVGTADGTAILWSVSSQTQQATLVGHGDAVNAAAFSPDGSLLATASADGTVRLWDTLSGETLAVLQGAYESVSSVAFSPDGKLIATASRDHTVRLWGISGYG